MDDLPQFYALQCKECSFRDVQRAVEGDRPCVRCHHWDYELKQKLSFADVPSHLRYLAMQDVIELQKT